MFCVELILEECSYFYAPLAVADAGAAVDTQRVIYAKKFSPNTYKKAFII